MAKIPKKPKRPKKSASMQAWKNWDERMKAWDKRVKEIKAAPAAKDKIANKWR